MISSVIACIRGRSWYGVPSRPALDLARGDLGHHLAVALHALAVEGRQQQLALADVRLLVEDEDRVLAEDRAQDLVALAGVEDVRVAGEDLLDVLRVGDASPRSPRRRCSA